MLQKLEMHDIQDKTRLLDEMNETRQGVNENRDALNALKRRLANHLQAPPKAGPKPTGDPKLKKPKTGPVKANPEGAAGATPGALGLKPD